MTEESDGFWNLGEASEALDNAYKELDKSISFSRYDVTGKMDAPSRAQFSEPEEQSIVEELTYVEDLPEDEESEKLGSIGRGILERTLGEEHKLRYEYKPPNWMIAPWPRPSPWDPERMPPTVISVPPAEIEEFVEVVVKRYLRQVQTHWPKALHFAMKNEGLKPSSDAEFLEMVSNTAFAKLIHVGLDPKDVAAFGIKDYGVREDKYLKMDTAVLEHFECYPGMYVAPCVVLMTQSRSGVLSLEAIQVNDEIFKPQDGKHWGVAKAFALQGVSIDSVLCSHARVHFPMDAINAVTKSVFPRGHVVRELMEPHMYLQLPLNFGILYNRRSVTHNNPNELYTPFPAKRDGIFAGIAAGFAGIEGNSCYPKYEFKLGSPKVFGEYGDFLQGYYDVIHRMVCRIVENVPRDAMVQRWAKACSDWLPGFPNAELIQQPGVLEAALATFIHNVSVVHSTEHYSYANEIPSNQAPLRLRIPPPQKKYKCNCEPTDALYRRDILRQEMSRHMYFKPTTLINLRAAKYDFKAQLLCAAITEYKGELAFWDQSMRVKRFAPLADMACSIQF